MDDKEERVAMRAVSHDEEGRKRVEKIEVNKQKRGKIKYIEKKLIDKGVQRMDRHPANGVGLGQRAPHKGGHGGKYTWEGPESLVGNEFDVVPPAVDEGDPNYVDEEEETSDVAESVIEVAKEVPQGVGRVEIDTKLVHN